MRGRIKMLAPTPILHDPAACLLADVRALLNSRRELVEYPERLAALLGVDVFVVEAALEALTIDDEVLA
jgi:hypothetical protein